jgi:hypothetical protein
MPKEFYTERDIEDMAKKGVQSLIVTDNVVLTELAFEKADRLGVKLIRNHVTPPSAPVRPYISEKTQGSGAIPAIKDSCPECPSDLTKRVHDAVMARLGGQVDPALLDVIIKRVLNNVGLK